MTIILLIDYKYHSIAPMKVKYGEMERERQTYYLVRLSFIHKPINSIHQTRARRHKTSAMHTVGIYHVCHDIGYHANYGSLFWLALKFNERSP